jgi:SAM-dependent methyltransferase
MLIGHVGTPGGGRIVAADYKDGFLSAGDAISWPAWLDSPSGRYLLAWEQRQCDLLVEDVFGFYAVQCGMPALEGLRASRIARRIRAWSLRDGLPSAAPCTAGQAETEVAQAPAGVRVEHFAELPFGAQTLDLLVLPHVLEFAPDPHAVLREADRVLRPEGRLVVTGLNPVSLWGARGLLPGWVASPFLPAHDQLIAPPRLRDWLKLLSFESERLAHGCYRPACRTQSGLDRSAFLERAGDRWWPICGAVYALSAVKRVRAMRMVGPLRRRAGAAAPVAAAGTRRSAAETCDARARPPSACAGRPSDMSGSSS